MSAILRRLNEQGMDDFSDWISDGASGDIPTEFLSDPKRSEPLEVSVRLDATKALKDRFELGNFLCDALKYQDSAALELDRGFWSALALVFFDRLCPIDGNGNRKPLKPYYYVLSTDYRHHYRHLLRSPWQLCRDHGENSKFLLLTSKPGADRLGRHGEILEQFGGRQAALRSEILVSEAAKLFAEPDSGRPRKGVAGRSRGTVNRLGLVLRQLDLTYDADSMGNGALRKILPREFDRWK